MSSVTIAAVVVAVAAGLALSASPAAAGGPDAKTKTKISETIGPAAAGDPQSYTARSDVNCGKSTCLANFGKKDTKTRTIQWINCGIGMENGVVWIGAVLVGNLSNIQGYFSTVSNVLDGTGQSAVFEYKNPVVVPAGELLFILFSFKGPATVIGGGQCLVGGTIE